MNSADRNEMLGAIMTLRNEVYRQMGQFERDKVDAVDERGRGAIKLLLERLGGLEAEMRGLRQEQDALSEEVAGLMGDMNALAARVTLCEGRIGRLEAKP